MKFNKKTQQFVFSTGRNRYLLLRVNRNRWAFPLYFARHWSGLQREKLNTSYHLHVLCFELTFNNYGPIIKDVQTRG